MFPVVIPSVEADINNLVQGVKKIERALMLYRVLRFVLFCSFLCSTDIEFALQESPEAPNPADNLSAVCEAFLLRANGELTHIAEIQQQMTRKFDEVTAFFGEIPAKDTGAQDFFGIFQTFLPDLQV